VTVTELTDRYELRTLLAAYGTLRLYQAHDRKNDVAVAVGVFGTSSIAQGEFLWQQLSRRARQESELLASVVDVGRTKQAVYWVLDLPGARTLEQVLSAEDVSTPAVIGIVGQLTVALAQLHRHGIVHADLRPENILLSDSGRVALVDFGLAQSAWSPELERLWPSGIPHVEREFTPDVTALVHLLLRALQGHRDTQARVLQHYLTLELASEEVGLVELDQLWEVLRQAAEGWPRGASEDISARPAGGRADVVERSGALWELPRDPAEIAAARALNARLWAQATEVALRDTLSEQEVREWLEMPTQEVAEQREAGRLLAIHSADGTWCYPAWQFARGRAAVDLRPLSAVFPGNAEALARWAVRPSRDLAGRTPARAFSEGEAERVVALAQALLAPAR
jgi:hypothetical protein